MPDYDVTFEEALSAIRGAADCTLQGLTLTVNGIVLTITGDQFDEVWDAMNESGIDDDVLTLSAD